MISVGWAAEEADVVITAEEVGSALVGFAGVEGGDPISRTLANQILKEVDQEVGYQIVNSSLGTMQPLGLSMGPLSVVRHGDRFLGQYTDNSFRYYDSYYSYEGSSPGGWPSLAASGGTVVGAIIDGDPIWWNGSTTDSVACVVAPVHGVTLTNGTTNATKGYIDFCKDSEGTYYRVNFANELQASDSLGGTWTTIATSVRRACTFQGSVVATTSSTGGTSITGFRVYLGGSLVYTSPSIPVLESSISVRACTELNGRLILAYSHSTSGEAGIARSALNDYTSMSYVGNYSASVFDGSSGRQSTFGVFGSCALLSAAISGAKSSLYTADSGASWRVWSTGGKLVDGRLFGANGVSLSI